MCWFKFKQVDKPDRVNDISSVLHMKYVLQHFTPATEGFAG